MLKKYNELVWKYINGEEIDNIDELENDYKFMMQVISVSKDKKIYDLCSDNVKNNYEFVRFMINTFKSDKNFVDKIASEYFNKVGSSDNTAKELYFIMREIFKNRDEEKGIFYNFCCFKIYETDREIIRCCIEHEKESLGKNNFGLGFAYVIDYYAGKSDIITEYYAKRFLNEIFYEDENLSLEELIHSKVNDVNYIKSIGIKKFIIDFVRNYDEFLSDYLFVHINLIKNIEKDIIKIINNWDSFNEEVIDRKSIIFEQEANNLLAQYNASFDYNDVCVYIDKNLNLPVKFSIEGFDDYIGIDVNKINLIEYECLRKIVKLVKDLYNSPIIDRGYIIEEKEETQNTIKNKILEFKPNKRNTTKRI